MYKDNSFSSRMLDVITHIVIFLVLVATVFPILHVFSISLSNSTEIMKRHVTIFPKHFDLTAYKTILTSVTIPRAFLNSVIITLLGTAINLLLTLTLAYPLSKGYLAFRKFYMILIVITMFFGGGLIPEFLLVNSLGMYNTYWAVTLPGAISTYNLMIMISFFKNFPAELEEAARLDGASEIRILFKIVLPLSMAAISTIGLFYMVGTWNSYFEAMIYLKDASKYPLQLIVRDIVIQNQMIDQLIEQGRNSEAEKLLRKSVNGEGLKYATLVISILPMIIVYPFVQKHFVKGVMIGSLKG